MKAAEDFLEVVLHGHIVAAAESLNATSGGRLSKLSQAIIDKFVQIVLPSPESTTIKHKKPNDQVFLYATEVMMLGLLWMNFHDAT